MLKLLLQLCIVAAVAWPLRAAEQPVPLKPAPIAPAELVSLSAKLRVKDVEQRREAVKRLAVFPERETAKLLIQVGLRDTAPEVRSASYDALLKFRDSHEVCDFLVERMNQEARLAKPDANAPLLLGVLLSSTLADVETATLRYLDEKLATVKSGPLFAMELADRLATRRDRADIAALNHLAQSKLFEQFVVRRGVIRALANVEHVDGVDAIIKLLDKIDGEARADAAEYLMLVTGQRWTTPAKWTTWWMENKSSFEYPKPFVRPPFRALQYRPFDSESSFYGFPIYAKRLVFVLDSSGSMQGERLATAKRELSTAVQQLRDNVQFAIVVFNGDVIYWKRQLSHATTTAKADALQFIDRLAARSNTATYEGLQAAFNFDVEAIYLLTDGAPTSGRIVEPVAIVEAITSQNRTRRQSIYTIGVSPGEVDSPFEVFLRNLADANYGLYRRVEKE